MNQETCKHIWIANSGVGGPPRFNIRIDVSPVMHVTCCDCGARTFFTEKQWYAMNEAADSDTTVDSGSQV